MGEGENGLIYWIFPIVIFIVKMCGVVVPDFITILAIISFIAAVCITVKDTIDNYRTKKILNALEKQLRDNDKDQK